MAEAKTYPEMKAELEDILDWFEQSDIDVEEALKKHKQAEALLKKIEKYLESTKKSLKT